MQTAWRKNSKCVVFTMDTDEHQSSGGDLQNLQNSIRKLRRLLEHVSRVHQISKLFGLIDVTWRWRCSGDTCHDVHMHNTECDYAMRWAKKNRSSMQDAYKERYDKTFPQLTPDNSKEESKESKDPWTGIMLQHYENLINCMVKSMKDDVIGDCRCVVTVVDASVLHAPVDGDSAYDSDRYHFGMLTSNSG